MKTALAACLSIVVICLTLSAGLWPFHAPLNDVSLLPAGRGIRFGVHGVVFSNSPLLPRSRSTNEGLSLEISVAPDSVNQRAVILAFSSPEEPDLLTVKQADKGLLILCRGRSLYIENVFRLQTQVYLTLVAKWSDLSVYIDGKPARTERFPLSLSDLAGQIVMGTSPVQDNHWYGRIDRLAIYARPLGERANTVAFFSFGNVQGRTIKDQVPGGVDLYVPYRYILVRQKRFEPFWQEVSLKGSFFRNCLINVAGFVPLGLIVCAFLSLTRLRRPLVLTVALGFLVSFTIELMQSYLPTRDSGTTDLFTNTGGAALGAWLWKLLKR